ncbi:MAG: hypothetical protein ACYC69_17205 [Thermodesulfovibrionales bacterium]
MKRLSRMTGKFLAVALMVLAGVLCTAAYGYFKYGRSAMADEYRGTVLHAEMPQIDTLTPARVETATFGLG